METKRENRKKVRVGTVVSNKMQNTVTIRAERRIQHPQYKKIVLSGKKYYAHHENKEIPLGAKVRIEETRPLSKLKRWRVIEVLG
jgi:small subunit ribosomal protein S17